MSKLSQKKDLSGTSHAPVNAVSLAIEALERRCMLSAVASNDIAAPEIAADIITIDWGGRPGSRGGE